MYQIEVSNICSLTCSYCPHPGQLRPKSMMSADTFAKCVEVFLRCENEKELFLHNFGEVLLHPQLPELLSYARDRGVKCSFFTNGMRNKKEPVDRGTWERLAEAGLETVDFSAHQMTAEEFTKIVDGVVAVRHVFNPLPVNLKSWAGQVGPAERPSSQPCLFQRTNAFVVLWDGRISACCLDAEGQRKDLHIDDLLRGEEYQFRPIRLCGTCNSMRQEEVM